MMSKYAVVIAGGSIDDDFALRFLSSGTDPKKESLPDQPLLIAADRGLVFLDRHGIVPDLVVGDFDSAGEDFAKRYLQAHPEVEVHRYGWEKDYTDTEIAARYAADLGCGRIDILGATGTRIDHVLGSIQLLAMLLERGVCGRILDPCNRISMHRESFLIRKKDQWGKYVSFFSWGGPVHGLTLKGFHFPLDEADITSCETLTVSNQIEADTARVLLREGTLLMVESKDRAGG